jgi:hypothetical protein
LQCFLICGFCIPFSSISNTNSNENLFTTDTRSKEYRKRSPPTIPFFKEKEQEKSYNGDFDERD